MTRTQIVVRGALALAATVVTFLTSACEPRRAAPDITGTPRDSAEQVLYGARSVLASNGLRRGEMSGDTVMTFDAATRFEFQGLRAAFVTTLGRPLSTLTAPAGTYRVADAAFVTHGHVAIQSDTTRRRLEGDAIRYDIAKNQFSSDSAFVATVGTRRLSGVGFTADPGLFSVKCVQQCTGSLGP